MKFPFNYKLRGKILQSHEHFKIDRILVSWYKIVLDNVQVVLPCDLAQLHLTSRTMHQSGRQI